jgi:hypothetical protein
MAIPRIFKFVKMTPFSEFSDQYSKRLIKPITEIRSNFIISKLKSGNKIRYL